MKKNKLILISVTLLASAIAVIIFVKSKKGKKQIGNPPKKSKEKIQLEKEIKELIQKEQNSMNGINGITFIDDMQLYRFSLEEQELTYVLDKITYEDLRSLKYIIEKFFKYGVKSVQNKIDQNFLKELADENNLKMELS